MVAIFLRVDLSTNRSISAEDFLLRYMSVTLVKNWRLSAVYMSEMECFGTCGQLWGLVTSVRTLSQIGFKMSSILLPGLRVNEALVVHLSMYSR